MQKAIFVISLLISLGSQGLSQEACVIHVTDGDVPVPGASVWLNGRPVGTTNAQGLWSWSVAKGRGHVQALGFARTTFRAEEGCPGGRLDVVLQPVTYELGGATVVGSMSPARLKESPIRTTVLSAASLDQTYAQDLVESLDFSTGVRETVGCGVCGTNSVQLNGMAGVYSLVLLDGVPLLGGLASAYALDGLPLSMVQQVEVIQGPASASFGSQAVGGVVNVVLSPLHRGDAYSRVRLDGHGRTQVSGSTVWGGKLGLWQVGLDGLRFQRRIDDNDDGFTDAPTMNRVVTTLRHQRTSERRRGRMTARLFAEERFGGDLDFQESDRGTESVYGERIDLLRSEVTWGSAPIHGTGWTWQGGGAWHRQASTYGTTQFDAQEFIGNVDVFHSGWTLKKGDKLRGGASVLWDVYQDETPAQSDMNVWVPAVFGEHSGARGAWSWIHGLRVERPSNEGLVLAPRLNVKWAPQPLWDVRFNSGRGYRRVHLFTEEHAALDGSREVLVPDGGLNPESSWNANVSITRTLGTERWTGSASVQAFGTLFTDRIYADYDSLPNAIFYRNIEGLGWNRGVSADVWMNGTSGWQASFGATWLRSELFESGSFQSESGPVEFAPSWTTNAKIGHTGASWGWNAVAQTVGRMTLPYYNETWNDESDPYALIHVSVNRSMVDGRGGRHTLALGIQNVTNTIQPSPLLGTENPFSEAFDASRIYGPLEGRRAFIEWMWRLEGR